EDDALDGEDVLPGFRPTLRSVLLRQVAAPARAPAPPVVASGKDGRALAAAIVAEPDDDLPRLAYADWCEEDGDPEYAEFIRAQCALARLPWDDPQRAALRAREAQLVPAAHQRYQALPGFRRGLSFERGFPRIPMTAVQLLKHAGQLHEAGPVL